MAPSPRPTFDTTEMLLRDPSVSYLKVLAAADHPEVDIVAIHGLRIPLRLAAWRQEHAFGVMTWISQSVDGENVLWLKDFLPLRIKNARVLLFGYNSNVVLNTSTAGVTGAADDLLAKLKIKRKDCKDRPIVFLCHSLGGIVVKHAISKARSTSEYNDIIYGQVRAIAFFATPHRGGWGAELGQALFGGARHMTRNVRSSIMEALREDSLISSDIHQYFLACLSDNKIRVCSFYETKAISPLTSLIVDKNSARLGLPYPFEVTYPVPEANHSEVCKFGSENENYNVVISKIEELVDWALVPTETPYIMPNLSTLSVARSYETATSDSDFRRDSSGLQIPSVMFDIVRPRIRQSHSLSESKDAALGSGPIYVLPDATSANFVGRRSIMDRLQETLGLDQSQHVRAALYGLGGSGKTQIALKIASWYMEKYPSRSIFWLRGGNAASLMQSFAELAIQCNLLQEGESRALPLEEMRRFLLNEENGKWLMIVDNADSAKTFNSTVDRSSTAHDDAREAQMVPLITLLPRCAHGQILFTTKSKEIAGQLTMQSHHVIEVRPMDEQESRELLSNCLFGPTDSSINPPRYEREAPTDQALEKLCTHLGHLPLALAQAAAFIRQRSLTINEYIKHLEMDDKSLEEILNTDFLSYGIEDDFSKAVASTWKVSFDHIERDSPSAASLLSLMAFLDPDNIPKFLLRQFDTDEWQLTAKSLGVLQGYALVQPIPGTESFKIHRMVQLAVRKRLASPELPNCATTWASTALKLLADNFPSKSLENSAALIPHAVQVLKNGSPESMADKLSMGILNSKVGWHYTSWGQLTDAEKYSQQAWEYLKLVRDPPKEIFLDVKANYTLLLKESGRLQEAEDLAKEVLAECRKQFGETHKDTVQSYDTLARIYQDQGHYVQGIKVARSTLKSLQKRHDVDDISVMHIKLRLGFLLHCQGDDKEGETLVQEAYSGYVKVLGSQNQLTLRTRWNLAVIIHSQARFEESMEISMKTWGVQKRTIGEQHPDSIKTQLLVAMNLQAQSKFQPALEYMRSIHKIATAGMGSHHKYSLFATSKLASCLIASAHGVEAPQAYEEAEEFFRVVLAGTRQQLRKDHPDILVAKTGLATALRLRRSFEEAEALQREALTKLKRELNKDHPKYLSGQENLARILCERKASKRSTKEGLKLAQGVLKKREKRFGWNHKDTKRIAELVIELLPSGRQRVKLADKVDQESSVVVVSSEVVPEKAVMDKKEKEIR